MVPSNHHLPTVAAPILLVCKGLDVGGLERIVVDLSVGCTRRGVPVEVAVVNDRRVALLAELRAAGIPVHLLGGSDSIGLRAWWRLGRLMRSGRFAQVHAHGPLVAAAARLVPGGAPVVSVSHQMWGGLRRGTQVLWRLTAWRDAVTVAVSPRVRTSLPAPVAGRAVVISHGIDPDEARRHPRLPRTDGGPFRALTIASHRAFKNYPNLLHAVRRARDQGLDVELVAVGSGDLLPEHQALAVALGLGPFVEFRPSSTDRWSLLTEADVLVVASDFEGHPLVVMEAMALGVPVVATAVGLVPEIVDEHSGLVVAPGDPVALAVALAKVAHGEIVASPQSVRTLDESMDDYLRLSEAAGASALEEPRRPGQI